MKALVKAETQLRELLEGKGWKVTHKGWPDFACIRNGKMIFIEVKNYRGEMLKKEQHFMLTHLAKLGLNCFRWTPTEGFQKITPATPLPTSRKKRGPKLTYEQRLALLTPEEREEVERDGLYV